MIIQREKKSESNELKLERRIRDELTFKRKTKIETIEEMKKRVVINALCFTCSLEHALDELDVSYQTMRRMLEKYRIRIKDLPLMRKSFNAMKIEVKTRFKKENYGECKFKIEETDNNID